jgi:hypothetical protein
LELAGTLGGAPDYFRTLRRAGSEYMCSLRFNE